MKRYYLQWKKDTWGRNCSVRSNRVEIILANILINSGWKKKTTTSKNFKGFIWNFIYLLRPNDLFLSNIFPCDPSLEFSIFSLFFCKISFLPPLLQLVSNYNNIISFSISFTLLWFHNDLRERKKKEKKLWIQIWRDEGRKDWKNMKIRYLKNLIYFHTSFSLACIEEILKLYFSFFFSGCLQKSRQQWTINQI